MDIPAFRAAFSIRWRTSPRSSRGVMDKAGVESAHIIGAKTGGAVAMRFAADYPKRTRTLVVVGGPASPLAIADPRPFRSGIGSVRDVSKEMIAYWNTLFSKGDREGVKGLSESLSNFDLAKEGVLQRIKAPTLVITADRSKMNSVEKARALPGADSEFEARHHPQRRVPHRRCQCGRMRHPHHRVPEGAEVRSSTPSYRRRRHGIGSSDLSFGRTCWSARIQQDRRRRIVTHQRHDIDDSLIAKLLHGVGKGVGTHLVLADRITAQLDDDRFLFSQRRQRPAVLTVSMIDCCKPAFWAAGSCAGPHVFAVHLARGDEDRQLHEARFESGLAPQIVVHAGHALGEGGL